jgi:hypothetical protein
MGHEPPNPEPTCWSCGAPNDRGSTECWLCQRRDWSRYPRLRTRLSPPPALPERGPLSTIGGWMVLIAAIGVSLAILVLAPPLFVVLLASAVPALSLTEIRTYRRRRRGEPVSGWQRLAWFLGLTILLPIVLVAVVICLFALCYLATR